MVKWRDRVVEVPAKSCLTDDVKKPDAREVTFTACAPGQSCLDSEMMRNYILNTQESDAYIDEVETRCRKKEQTP